MAETPENATATTAPVPVDTQSVPIPGGLTPPPAATPPPVQTPAAAPQVPQKPGEFFHNMSHAFSGAILGAMAGREKIASYTTDETGKQTPVIQKMTTGDQLRQIARSALLGLSAGAQSGTKRSGLATALAGAGAGAEDAVARAKEQDLLKRKQSTEEFERGQQATLAKATNAHIAAQTAVLGQDLFDKTLESQEKVASVGRSQYAAMVGVGNAAPVSDMHKDELLAWRDAQPDKQKWMDYIPLLTRVAPRDGAEPDPKTGLYAPEDIDRRYSLVDLKKDIPITSEMKDHLMTVKFPGADALEVGKTVPGAQYAALWNQGLVLYNQMANDLKNKEVIDVTGSDGTPMKAVYNKALDTTEILRDENGKPLGGKVETMETRLIGDGKTPGVPNDGKTHVVLQNKLNGHTLKDLGVAGTAAENELHITVGDYGRTGQDFINSLPPQMRDTVQAIHDRRQSVTSLPRGQEKQRYIDAVNHAFPDDPYDEKKFNLEYQYLKEYQGGTSGEGAARDRINTAIGHLDLLGQVALGPGGQVSQNSLRTLNQLANMYGVQTDQPGPVLYDIIAAKAAAEAANAVKVGGSASDVEIETQRKNMSREAGPQQQRAQIAGNMDLLKTQVGTIRNKFMSNMSGKTPEDMKQPVISAPNQAILDKWTAPPASNTQGGALPPNPATGKPYASYSAGPGGHMLGYNGTAWVDAKTGQPVGAK